MICIVGTYLFLVLLVLDHDVQLGHDQLAHLALRLRVSRGRRRGQGRRAHLQLGADHVRVDAVDDGVDDGLGELVDQLDAGVLDGGGEAEKRRNASQIIATGWIAFM